MRLALVVPLGLVVTVATDAHAAEPPEQRLAREEVRKGLDAARSSRWEEAREAFARAYDLWKKPSILFNLAGAQAKTLRLVDAAESYRTLLRAGSDASAEERALAQRALEQLEPRIAHLRLVIRGGALEGDRITVDGRPTKTAALDTDLPTDPGRHEITLERPGAKPAAVTITLAEGETRAITLVPVAELGPPLPSPPPSRSVLASPWFWTVVGVVVVGGTVSTVCIAGGCTAAEERQPHTGSLGSIVLR